MTIHGHVQNGVIVLDAHGPLPEGAAVQVEVMVPKTPGAAPRTLADRYKNAIGAVDDLPADMAENHDDYLHGTSKS